MPERVEQLERASLPGPAARRVDRPRPRRRALAVRGVVDEAVAGKLVGLLPVLAPALPVALAGQAAVAAAAAGRPCPARGHRLISARTVSVPLRCCSGPRPVSTIAPLASPRAGGRRALHRPDRHPGDPLDPLGPVRGTPPAAPRRSPTVRAAMYASSTRPSAIAMCSRPLASARSVPGVSCRCSVAPLGGRGPARVDDDQRARRAPADRSNHCMIGGIVSAQLLPHSRMHRARRRDRRRETAARGRSRTPCSAPPPPRTCRSGRCSRCCGVRSATPGELAEQHTPSRWSAPPLPKTATLSGPCADCARRISAVTRASATSQLAGSSGAPRCARTSGVVSRSREVSNSADDHPFWHRPPRFVGKSRLPTSRCPPASRRDMPHCSAQYGQCVKTVAADIPQPCAASVIRSLHARYIRETATSPPRDEPGAITRPGLTPEIGLANHGRRTRRPTGFQPGTRYPPVTGAHAGHPVTRLC